MRDIDRRRRPSAPHEGGTAEDDVLVAVDVGHVLYREEFSPEEASAAGLCRDNL